MATRPIGFKPITMRCEVCNGVAVVACSYCHRWHCSEHLKPCSGCEHDWRAIPDMCKRITNLLPYFEEDPEIIHDVYNALRDANDMLSKRQEDSRCRKKTT